MGGAERGGQADLEAAALADNLGGARILEVNQCSVMIVPYYS